MQFGISNLLLITSSIQEQLILCGTCRVLYRFGKQKMNKNVVAGDLFSIYSGNLVISFVVNYTFKFKIKKQNVREIKKYS